VSILSGAPFSSDDATILSDNTAVMKGSGVQHMGFAREVDRRDGLRMVAQEYAVQSELSDTNKKDLVTDINFRSSGPCARQSYPDEEHQDSADCSADKSVTLIGLYQPTACPHTHVAGGPG
jgi:hypothetical protein